ncbi:MAG: beta strand repeat-containing protein [Paenirhodobacter sp.]|uniref:beta strand repeat-containing protein n=1 Tax=Paenirhodobacter sp. TaxID=1965326 RepID=UPI003D143764
MTRLIVRNGFDIADLQLGDFVVATVSATDTRVTYTLGNQVLTLNGSFVLSGGVPVGGTITSASYTVGGTSMLVAGQMTLDFDAFETAMSNDEIGGLLSGSDEVIGTAENDILRGYDGNDLLRGGLGADTMFGGAGNDTLQGDGGNDLMVGGSGDDIYRVINAGDQIYEFRNGGIDRVETTLNSYTLGDNVDNLTFTGSGNFTGIGNALANEIIGAAGDDLMRGGNGADTLRGANGNDTLYGGNGDDMLVGDAGGTEVVSVASTPSPSNPDVDIALSTGVPEASTTTSTTVTGYVSNTGAGEGNFNLAFVLDVSGSMGDAFAGADVGDLNGDGIANTKLDATIAAFQQLVESIQDAGIGDDVRIAVIPFSDSAIITTVGSALSDNDGNGVPDVIDAALQLQDLGGTYYNTGLQQAIDFFNSSPAGTNQVFFISDGAPSSDNYDSLLATLRDPNGINATIRALGINATGSYYDVLDELDDGALNDSALNVLSPEDLTAGLLNSQVSTDDIEQLEIWLNGTLIATLTPDQLTETPFGLQYSVTVPGLDNTGTNVIETRLVLNDADGTVISNTQTVTVGALASNDSLEGGDGNDTLDGGAGVDTLVGGDGDDVYRVNSTGDRIVEAANAGTDTVESTVTYTLNRAITANVENLTLLGSEAINGTGNARDNLIIGNLGNNVLEGLGGNDTLNGGYGNDTASFEHAASGVNASLYTGIATLSGETDTLINIENLTGSAFADSLYGDTGDNVFVGLGGNDTINGYSGFDTVDYSGATSAVTVVLNTSYSGGTATSADGGEGTDQLVYIDAVVGSRFGDVMTDGNYYSGQDNLFIGGNGYDTMSGGYGNDTLIGGSGNDSMDGGADYGSTHYIDTVDYSAATAAISGRMEGLMTSTSTGTDRLSGFEHIIATDYNDSIIGAVADEWFEGGAGRDTILGGAGNDTIDGGAAVDRMVGGTGDDLYYVNNSSDVVVEAAGAGDDTVMSSVDFRLSDIDVENLILTAATGLTGIGNAGANVITGGAGNDRLLGVNGDDTLFGNDGDDILQGGNGNDSLNGGNGTDWAVFSDLGAGVTGTLNGSSAAEFTSTTGNDTLSYIENVIGTNYADSITGDGYANELRGQDGDDTLTGGSGDDTLMGGSGDDLLDGGYGTDLISYAYFTGRRINVDLSTGVVIGDGTDTIVGNSIEHVIGTSLNDIIAWKGATATYTAFTLEGGAGNDSLGGSSGSDTLLGGTGADTMAGAYGSDTYEVDNAGDVVVEDSSYGYDRVISSINYTLGDNVEYLTLTGSAWAGTGNALSNDIVGNELNNWLRGFEGSDTLTGGLGQDTLDAGVDTNYDIFVFTSVEDSAFGAADQIRNFDDTRDDIYLYQIDANSVSSGDQAFSFIGTTAFSGSAGELRYEQSGGNTYVYGDVDGDRVADFEIELVGLHDLTTSNFYL